MDATLPQKRFGIIRHAVLVHPATLDTLFDTPPTPEHFIVQFADGSSALLAAADAPPNLYFCHQQTIKVEYRIEVRNFRDWAYDVVVVTDAQQEASPVGLRYTEGKLRTDLIHPEFLSMIAEVMTENPDLRIDLIPKSAIRELGLVFTEGVKKYPARNWEKGMPWSKVIGPLWRHWLKWLAGSRRDEELPRCHHLGQLMWNAAVLLEFESTHPEQDDRATSYADWKPKDPIA